MPYFLEFMPYGIDKAKRLAVLLQHLNILPSELIACGDGYNDLSMVQYAGLGVAMANGCEEIKAVANYITHSNDEDGIAHVIEQFMLK
jgi:hydroxymethylpyrimidine pyrophosphatase-like HAD family hydrolase